VLRIEIEPSDALVDEAVAVKVAGCPPGQPVSIRARMAGYLGCAWESRATFRADARGCADLATARPETGSYDGVDAMGLFWSMAADGEPAAALVDSAAPLEVRVDAAADGEISASAVARRRFAGPGVTRAEVRDTTPCREVPLAARDAGIAGTLFRPSGAGPHPAVIVLGGSSGDVWEAHAALLASRGFAALALAYFGAPTLPSRLAQIPLEYFRSAIGWLRRQPGIDPGALAVLGGSRGGELALLLGATFPEIRAVVAYVPSGVLWEGMGEPGKRPASWTLGGEAQPFLRRRDDAIDWTQAPIALTPGFLAALQDGAAVSEAAIAVERTRGAMLLISAGDDRMWPSARLAEIAMERLRQKGFGLPAEHLSYAGAGHLVVSPPHLPATVDRARHPIARLDFAFGGSPAAEAAARADAWPRVIAWLQRYL